jgi:hypothetical protein
LIILFCLFQATDEYDYFKTNTAFSNQYIDEFISKTLQDQIIPDLLIESIAFAKRDFKKDETTRRNFNDPLKEEATQLLFKVNQNLDNDGQQYDHFFAFLNFVCPLNFLNFLNHRTSSSPLITLKYKEKFFEK